MRTARQKIARGSSREEDLTLEEAVARDQNPRRAPAGNRGGGFFEFLQSGLREGIPADLRKISGRRCHAVSRRFRDFARSERGRLLLFAGNPRADTAPPPIVRRQTGETAGAAAVYHRGRRARAWLYLVKLLARYPAHHADAPASPTASDAVASATPAISETPSTKIIAPRALQWKSRRRAKRALQSAPSQRRQTRRSKPTERARSASRRAGPPEDLDCAEEVPRRRSRRIGSQITPMRKTYIRVTVEERRGAGFRRLARSSRPAGSISRTTHDGAKCSSAARSRSRKMERL